MRKIKANETAQYERTKNNRFRHMGMVKSKEVFRTLSLLGGCDP